MPFFHGSNLKHRELEAVQDQINERLNDPNRTTNTDSVSALLYVKQRVMREYWIIFNAELERFTQVNDADRRVLNVQPPQPVGNVHNQDENVNEEN